MMQSVSFTVISAVSFGEHTGEPVSRYNVTLNTHYQRENMLLSAAVILRPYVPTWSGSQTPVSPVRDPGGNL